MMIFVPTSYEDARALRSGRELAAAPGCAATESLIAALGPGTSAEEAEYAALNNAGVLAIMQPLSRRGSCSPPRWPTIR